MKSMRVWLSVLTVVASLALWGSATTVLGQEGRERERELGARLERLEHAVHQLAERVERAGPAAMEHRMMPPQMPAPMTPPCPPCGAPPVAAKCPLKGKCWLALLLPLILVINILLAVWVFTDIRKRGEGHGVFIALALIAGLPGAILYSLVRLGDKVGQKTN